MRLRLPFSVLCVSLLALASSESFRDQYRKLEYMITMRDGVKLYTNVYLPRKPHGKSPILMERTPYGAGPYGKDAYVTGFDGSIKFQHDGFIFVTQDVRGRYLSEGEFADVRPQLPPKHGPKEIDESTDAYDSVEFLVKNVPGNNGRVGVRGISYPGFYAAAAGINSHPAIKAISPQAPVSDWFLGDDWHHNGALFLQDIAGFYGSFGQVRQKLTKSDPPSFFPPVGKDAYQFFLDLGSISNINTRYYKGRIPFWNQVVQHPSYDEFWQARNVRNKMANVGCAVLTVGGLFDAEDMAGAFEISKNVGALNPQTPNFLVMGPWYHGMWEDGRGNQFGGLDFHQDTSTYFQEQIEYPFFAHYLNNAPDPNLAAATLFDAGSNEWRHFSSWPPSTSSQTLTLADKGKLTPGLAASREISTDYEEYLSDPGHPVPYQDGLLSDRTREYMLADQRFASKRADVVTFKGPELTSDTTAVGPVRVNLFASSTGSDGDFVVKLIDEYPSWADSKMAGNQMLVRADIMRARFRNDDSRPEPLIPGQVTPIRFDLNGICYTFRKGHHFMVQVQSSWFPLVDRNPNRFVDIYHATETDFQKATIRIYHTPEFPSRVEIGILK